MHAPEDLLYLRQEMTSSRPWFEDFRDVIDRDPDFRRFIEAEDAARAVWSWQPEFIPGVLQTPAYAHVAISLYPLTRPGAPTVARCVILVLTEACKTLKPEAGRWISPR